MLLLALAPPEALAQCAMCRTALTNSEEGRAIGAQFNRAILVLIAAPYLVFGVIMATVFRHRIRALWRRLVHPAGAPAPDLG